MCSTCLNWDQWLILKLFACSNFDSKPCLWRCKNNGNDGLAFIRTRPYQIWANVSDLYVSWSKVAIGFIIHKNDKKIESIVFDAYSMSVSMETTQNIEQCKISTIERARTKKIFLKWTRTNMFLYAFNTFDLLILCFLRYLRFIDFFMILGLRFWFLMLTGTGMKLK